MFRFLFNLAFVFLFVGYSFAQIDFGIGASLHRYDQVLSLKGVNERWNGDIGFDLGLGVERSLQGSLAPQVALFWQAPISLKNRHYSINQPFYAVRYQFDMQKATITDTYHGLYFSLGYAFGVQKRLDLQLSLGVLAEKIYGLESSQQNKHFLLNPQLQLNFYIFKRKK